MNARLDQYHGVWSIHEPAARAIESQVRAVNLQLHLERQAAAVRPVSQEPDPDVPGLPPVPQMPLDPDAYQPPPRGRGYLISNDGLAVIELNGVFTKYGSSLLDGPSTVQARRALRNALADPKAQAICLLIDSPGGSAFGIADLAADVAAANRIKPVVAYCEDLCASAGYYVASQAARIIANPSCEVGSIGTYIVVEDLSEAASLAGIKVHVLSSGGIKGGAVDGVPIQPEVLAEAQRIVDAEAERFALAICYGRRKKRDEVKAMMTGQCWTAQDALRLGLVDQVGTFNDALAAALRTSSKSEVRSQKSEAELREPCSGSCLLTADSVSEENTMPNENGATAVAAAPQPQPEKPASVAELKTIAGSTAEFRESCQEAGLTLKQAQAMFAAQPQNATLEETEPRPNPKAVVQRTTPLGTEPAVATASPDNEFLARRDALIKSGAKRDQATRQAAKEFPEAHAAYVTDHNHRAGRKNVKFEPRKE